MNLFRVKMQGLITGAVVLITCMGTALLPSRVNTSHDVFGDHPEQTMKRKEMEKSVVTLEDVAKFAEEYVRKNSKDGLFTYYDKGAKKELELIFDKIHQEKLSQTKKHEYFVCADFKGKDGKAYDLDLFVQGKSKGYFNIDKKSISIHKINGKEYYTWSYHEKKGIWVKKIMETENKQHAQPAYPKPDYP